MLYDFVKRLIDIFGSIFLIILFSPLMLLSAIIIRITSPEGSVLVEKDNKTAQRVGKNGKIFYHYKFRSMIPYGYNALKNDPKFKKLYKEYIESGYKLKDDPRVTKFGKFIRKYSIDEMPQLFNVLKGEMSIVGPRPYFRDELNEQQKKYPSTVEYVKKTVTVKPGITGYWQVNGRSHINFERRIEMDANYATRKSLWDDIVIILKTPFAMVSGRGAV